MRNALLNSTIDKARAFESIHGWSFGWNIIEQFFLKETLSHHPRTKLDMKSVNPDRWSKIDI